MAAISTSKAKIRACSKALQHRLYANIVAGRHPLPSAMLPSSGHTFFVTLRFFLQETVTKDEDKKRSHARAADLCFLYLHVSQNTALYRNTERRPQQTSSSAEGFVFKLTEHKGRTYPVYCFTWPHLTLTVLQSWCLLCFKTHSV